MLDGSTLTITPLEGGGYEVHEHSPDMAVADVLATIGLAVVMAGVGVGLIALMEYLADHRDKKNGGQSGKTDE